ncbi:MAG: maleylpyruvate isomerase N-terminal domain-containing protein [Ilumatobacteraceae bacterium]
MEGIDHRRLFTLERSRLLALLDDLAPDDWARPTPCPAWDVAGLCRHLLGDDLHLIASHRDGHVGAQPPHGADEHRFIAWLDELQEGWVTAAARLSPRLVVELLAWCGPQVADLMAAGDPDAVTARVSWAGDGLAPVWLDRTRELSEYWIHRQQLLAAFGRTPDHRADVLGPVLDGLRWAYPYRLAEVPADAGDTAVVEVRGEVARTWFLEANGTGWRLADELSGPVVARAVLSTDQAWRLLTNNLPPAELDELDLSGDPAVVDVLRRTRAIIGEPLLD